MSIGEVTERTPFCPQTDGQTDGRRETSMTPLSTSLKRGYNKMAAHADSAHYQAISGHGILRDDITEYTTFVYVSFNKNQDEKAVNVVATPKAIRIYTIANYQERNNYFLQHGSAQIVHQCIPSHGCTRGPFYWRGLTLMPAWISNHTPSKVWDEISYPFPNFNGCTVGV